SEASVISAVEVVREFGAFRFAPSSTPTPSRSTSSPPSQPPNRDSPSPINDSTLANISGRSGSVRRSHQLPRNNRTTTNIVIPWVNPIVLARVPFGIAYQSINPNGAANKPPIMPAVIIQNATAAIRPLPQIR